MKKLALIGHTYCLAHNRWKAAAISAYYEVKCYVPELEGNDVLGRPLKEADQDNEPSLDYETVYLRKGGLKEKTTGFTLKGLEQELKGFAPDIVLIENEPWALLRWQTWFISQKLVKKPLFAEFTWENLRRKGWKGVLTGFIYRQASRCGDLVVCGNQEAQKIFIESGKAKSKTIVAAQLGVPDEPMIKPSPLESENWREQNGLEKDAFVIGYCGRFVEEKGILELLNAVERLNQKKTSYPVRLVLLGAGELEDEIRPRLKKLGIIHKSVKHFEVPHLMSQWNLAVLPSKPMDKNGQIWEEQFGRVIIESIYAGTPCIGSTSGAIPEVLGVPEAVFDHSNVDQLSSTIETFLDPEEIRALLTKQSEHITQNYTHSAIAKIYSDFIATH